MVLDIDELVRPGRIRKDAEKRVPGPRDAGFADAFAEVLAREELVDVAAISRAKRASEVAAERLDLVLVKLGLISEAALCIAYATFCGLPLVGPTHIPGQPILAERLKLPFLKANRVLPISCGEGRLLLAMADPFAHDVANSVSYLLDLQVDLAVIAPAELEKALRLLYRDAIPEAEEEIITAVPGEHSEFDVERLRDIANEAPVIRLVNQIISRAVEQGASDIHIEPGRDAVAIRFRVDGFLRQERTIPLGLRAALTTRIKIMAKLDIAERRLPLDGRIRTAVRGVEIDIRVSTLPTAFGESVVMRILDGTRVELDFEKLGLDRATEAKLRKLMALPNGIVLVTGPTGSGKTTTLYTALKDINVPELKLFTVEDPVEYQIAGINQVQIQPQIGFDFPAALRSILRQDPDVMMVGEIRDLETAQIAIQASLTGHLVFSTLHTNSAVAAITRLIDIGVERYLLASTVSGILAQRLVRKLCRSCARPAEKPAVPLSPFELPEGAKTQLGLRHEAIGCDACGQTGYKGRTMIAELLVIDDELRQLIGRRVEDLREIERLARANGFRSLYEDGLAKVGAGETTLEEVLRVTRAT